MLGKNFLIFFLIALFQSVGAQYIRVNDTSDLQSSYSPEDLVKKVLVGCAGANISNVEISNQLSYSNRSFGYFNQNGTAFPFKEGIVISTGFTKNIGNTLFDGILDDNLRNGGDADLAVAIGTSNLVDASFIEFDFVPTSDKISFRYVFASEEYNAQPCRYDDGFALLLKKYNADGTSTAYKNLAVLPNGDPVKVTKIHPSYSYLGNNLQCPAINETYFGGYNSISNLVTNFDGFVVPLIAEALVIPNEKYHLKIVLADAQNYRYDSGVFLEAGSFNTSVYITGNLNVCGIGGTTTITANTSTIGAYQWYKDGLILNGETNQNLQVSVPGVYRVVVASVDCEASASVVVLGKSISIEPPPPLDCSLAQITLDATASIYNAGSTFQWTASNGGNIVSGAQSLTPVVNTEGTYTLAISEGCTVSKSVNVIKDVTKPTISLVADKTKICKGESVILTAFGANSYVWDASTGSSNTITVNPTQTTTYQVSGKGSNGCISAPQSITVEVLPEITSILTDAKTCNGDQIQLDAGHHPGYFYTWYFNGNLILGHHHHNIVVANTGIYKVVIDNGTCSKEFSATVSEPELPKITHVEFQNNMIIVEAFGSGTLEYQLIGNPNFTWQDSNAFKNIKNNSQYQIQVRIKDTSCFVFQDYFTLMIPNVITPNHDGTNDKLDLSAISYFDNFNFHVYDRFGKLVFHGTKNNPIWNGAHHGRSLPTGAYWYYLKFNLSGIDIDDAGWILLRTN